MLNTTNYNIVLLFLLFFIYLQTLDAAARTRAYDLIKRELVKEMESTGHRDSEDSQDTRDATTSAATEEGMEARDQSDTDEQAEQPAKKHRAESDRETAIAFLAGLSSEDESEDGGEGIK